MKDTIIDTILVCLSGLNITLSYVDVEHILTIVARILSILGTLITLLILVSSKIHTHLSDDGKLDKEEIEDIIDTAKDVLDKKEGDENE